MPSKSGWSRLTATYTMRLELVESDGKVLADHRACVAQWMRAHGTAVRHGMTAHYRQLLTNQASCATRNSWHSKLARNSAMMLRGRKPFLQ